MVTFKTSESYMFSCDGNKLLKLNYEMSNEHDEQVISYDYMNNKKMLVTADAEG
jgi:hypothetical protein